MDAKESNKTAFLCEIFLKVRLLISLMCPLPQLPHITIPVRENLQMLPELRSCTQSLLLTNRSPARARERNCRPVWALQTHVTLAPQGQALPS